MKADDLLKNIYMVCIMLLLTGCSNQSKIDYHYVFQGEDDLWIAEYQVDYILGSHGSNGLEGSKNNKSSTFVVKYKKDIKELENVRYISIKYDSGAEMGENSMHYNEPVSTNTFTIKSSGQNAALEDADTVVKVTIITDHTSRIFDLVCKQ